MSREIFCTNCGERRDSEKGNCKLCGSNEITVRLEVSENININVSESVKGKARKEGVRKPIKEFKYGDDFNRKLNKNVDRTMVVDRENNQYYEVIKDKQTGETIRECIEPLDKHQGHGNAKK